MRDFDQPICWDSVYWMTTDLSQFPPLGYEKHIVRSEKFDEPCTEHNQWFSFLALSHHCHHGWTIIRIQKLHLTNNSITSANESSSTDMTISILNSLQQNAALIPWILSRVFIKNQLQRLQSVDLQNSPNLLASISSNQVKILPHTQKQKTQNTI